MIVNVKVKLTKAYKYLDTRVLGKNMEGNTVAYISKEPIETVKGYRSKLTDYVNELHTRAGDYGLETLAEMRKIDVNVLKDAGVFYVGEPAEMLLPEYIDILRQFGIIAMNNKPIYSERWLIPIYDINRYVIGLVGYKQGVNEKYVYATPKYFNRGEAIYGLEHLIDCFEQGFAIVTEGIMDAIRVRSLGFKNVISTCGADSSWDRHLMFMGIKRCIFIPDRDRAGMQTNKHWKSETMIRLLVPLPFKDIDEFARQNKVTESFCKDLLENLCGYIKNDMTSGSFEEIDISKIV